MTGHTPWKHLRDGMPPIKLWLDDMRPAPKGWVPVRTVEEAKERLRTGRVTHASLDHDLGACTACMAGMTPEEWLASTQFQHMPHCDHYGTGYTLVCWMEEHDIWPTESCVVHSANPAGRAKMQVAIDKHYG